MSSETGQGASGLEWNDAMEDFLCHLAGSREEKTASYYKDRLRMFARWAHDEAEGGKGVSLAAFRARHMRQYLAYRANAVVPGTDRKISDRTRRHDAVACRVFLRFCAKEDYISGNPISDYAIPKAPKAAVSVPTDAEVSRLLVATQERWSAAKNGNARYFAANARTFYARRNFAIIAGLVETCCRIDEMLSLELGDFDAGRREVTVKLAKGDEARTLPISAAWVTAVEAYLRVRPKGADAKLLFVTEFGTKIEPNPYRKQFYHDQDFAGFERHYTLHSLRHYSLTQIARTNVVSAQQIAGHKSLAVTQGYLHADRETIRCDHAAANPLGRLLVNTRSQKQKKKSLL